MTAKMRSAPAMAASSTFTCWLIWEMGWLTCLTYSRYAPREPTSNMPPMASRPPTQQVTA